LFENFKVSVPLPAQTLYTGQELRAHPVPYGSVPSCGQLAARTVGARSASKATGSSAISERRAIVFMRLFPFCLLDCGLVRMKHRHRLEQKSAEVPT
jgi:hypothetical protein